MQRRKNPFTSIDKKSDVYESINLEEVIPVPKQADPTPQDLREYTIDRRKSRKPHYPQANTERLISHSDDSPGSDHNEMEFSTVNKIQISDFT